MKKIKKVFFKLFFMSHANEQFKKQPAVFESIVSADPKKLFVIVLAFNQPALIPLNAAACRKFIKDDYEYFVMDNSNRDTDAETIKQYCLGNRINYVRLPKNQGPDPSIHAGMALNWTFHNLIERFKPGRFGIMDSDLFPVKPVSISPYLDKGGAWGIVTDRDLHFLGRLPGKVWYLWLGLWFYRRERFMGREPNFLPDWGVDSGGRIRMSAEEIKKLPDAYRLQDPELIEISPGVIVHRYGHFIHFSAASIQSNALPEKERWMETLLQTNSSH